MGGAKVEPVDAGNHESVTSPPNLMVLEPVVSSSSLQLDLSRLSSGKVDDNNSEPKSSTARTEFSDEKSNEKNVEKTELDYRAYRHRLVEQVLRKYYDKQQPPGNVVMNSIHLNSQDDLRIHVLKQYIFGYTLSSEIEVYKLTKSFVKA